MAGGFFTNNSVPNLNTSIGGIAATGVDPSGNIDNLFQELAAQGKQYSLDAAGKNTVAGSANAILVTLASGNISANYDGLMFAFIAASDTSVTGPTLQVAGGAAVATLFKSVSGNKTVLAIGDVQAGSIYYARYRTGWTGWQLIDLNHPEATAVTVTFSNLDPALVVTSTETIASNDNDTTIPTTAAVIDYVAAALSGQAPTASIPVGTVSDYGGATAPAGWALCYGQAVSRTTYATLFGVISTTFGTGDGSTTFNLPDCRGRVTAGKDNMGGTSANRLTSPVNGDNLGATGGTETVALSGSQVPNNVLSSDYISGSTSAVSSAGHTGSGAAHNNIQPTIILTKMIYTGV